MALVDMTMSSEEAKEDAGIDPALPRYPWGLCLSLDNDSLKKLNLTSLPAIGTEMTVTARVKVTAVRAFENQNETESHSEQSVDLQITAMELSTAQSAQSAASTLYPGT